MSIEEMKKYLKIEEKQGLIIIEFEKSKMKEIFSLLFKMILNGEFLREIQNLNKEDTNGKA